MMNSKYLISGSQVYLDIACVLVNILNEVRPSVYHQPVVKVSQSTSRSDSFQDIVGHYCQSRGMN